MSDPVLEKRDNNCFISYASEDGAGTTGARSA